MRPHHIALAVLVFASGVMAGPLPKDPCALLTVAEIQALAPGAKIGNGKPDAAGAPLGTACSYSWGPRTSQWGETSVSVFVMDTSKAYPGHGADTLKEGLLAKTKAKDKSSTSSQVSGVGDVAIFTVEERSNNAKVDTVLGAKGYHLQVTFHGGDLAANKDKIVALAKAAAGRL